MQTRKTQKKNTSFGKARNSLWLRTHTVDVPNRQHFTGFDIFSHRNVTSNCASNAYQTLTGQMSDVICLQGKTPEADVGKGLYSL
jgi:hypothetical protein